LNEGQLASVAGEILAPEIANGRGEGHVDIALDQQAERSFIRAAREAFE
jgi:hypothetical protein